EHRLTSSCGFRSRPGPGKMPTELFPTIKTEAVANIVPDPAVDVLIAVRPPNRDWVSFESDRRSVVRYNDGTGGGSSLSESSPDGTGMSMGITDFIGGRGEAIAFTRLTRACRADSGLPYFWPHFRGEKCEIFDFLVELVDAGEQTPFFFVQ